MLVEYFLSNDFGREFDSPHLHQLATNYESHTNIQILAACLYLCIKCYAFS